MRENRNHLHGEKGQSLVELALSLTFLLLLLGGAVDLGRIFFTYIALRDAAQEGALYASIDPKSTVKIQNRVRASATSPIDTSGISSITIVQSPDFCPGSAISVKATYVFEISMPLMGAFIGQSFPISATVTDTILKSTQTGCT
jgi:Flp pilus assembly protein TadG